MKRLILTTGLAVGASWAVLGAAGVPAAHAKDLSGRIGIGASTAFGTRGLTGAQAGGTTSDVVPAGLTLPGLSLRYVVNDRIAVNPGFGVAYLSKAAAVDAPAESVTELAIGARAIVSLVHEANGHLYAAGGVVANLRLASETATYTKGNQVRVPLTFGVEFFFSRTSSFSVHAEGGFEIGYFMPETAAPRNVITANTVGGVFNVGFHWYFQSRGGSSDEEAQDTQQQQEAPPPSQ